MMPTAEQVLSNLPFAITLWTALTLCWGLYILTAHNKILVLSQANASSTTLDKYHSVFLMVGNAILVAFLMLQPRLTQYSDAIVVADVFFGAYLLAASIAIGKWWKNTARSPKH